MGRVVALREAGKTAEGIAAALNAEGYRPLRYGSSFSPKVVRDLLLLRGFTDERNDTSLLGPNEWHVKTLARELKMSRARLWDWATRGWVHSRRTAVQKVVILWADHGTAGFEEALLRHHGKRARPPQRPEWGPAPAFLGWHGREVFKGAARHL
jgi:hypothetical protein